MHRRRGITSLIAVLSLGVMVGGCARTVPGNLPWYVPTWGPLAEKNTSGIRSPADRIDDLQSLARQAPDLAPADQERISMELAAAMRDEPDPLVRAQIVRTSGAYPTGTASAVLRAALNDADRDVRIAACQVIGERGGADAAATLSGVVTGDADVDVRLAAVRALGDVSDPSAVGVLGLALEDANPAMQYTAVNSLRQSTGRDLGNDVNVWREFVASGNATPRETGLSERLLPWLSR